MTSNIYNTVDGAEILPQYSEYFVNGELSLSNVTTQQGITLYRAAWTKFGCYRIMCDNMTADDLSQWAIDLPLRVQIENISHRIDAILATGDTGSWLRLKSLYMARSNLYDQLNKYGSWRADEGHILPALKHIRGRKI